MAGEDGPGSGLGGAGAERQLTDLRADRPTPARMYDYFLGGKDHYEVDREAAERVIATLGRLMCHDIVWENRRFLQRAVRYLADAGVDQFLDLGTGLPTQGNVHEVAQEANPDARVVYVDNDPIVLAHGRALLATDANTTVITADLRQPEAVLGHPDLGGLIDFSRPVAVLFVAVLHFVTDEEDPAGLVAAFRDRLAPGSHLVLSHLTTDGPPPEEVAHVEAVYREATSPMVFRSRSAIEGLFDGFDLVRPGLVHPWEWHPHLATGKGAASPRTHWLQGGLARLSGGDTP